MSLVEATANMTFTVTLSGASGKTVTVDYATADATATSPADYTSAAGTVSFAPGVVTRTFTVPIVGDTLDEFDETFTANLSNPTNATIADNQGIGTITDNDPTPTLTFANVTVIEPDAGSVTATFTVTLSAASGKTVTVGLRHGQRHRDLSGRLLGVLRHVHLRPGQTSKTIAVAVQGDLLNEANETLHGDLTNPTNATIPVATRTGTITDNDPSPSLVINDVSRHRGQRRDTNADLHRRAVGRRAARTSRSTTPRPTAPPPRRSDYTTTSGTLTVRPGPGTQDGHGAGRRRRHR